MTNWTKKISATLLVMACMLSISYAQDYYDQGYYGGKQRKKSFDERNIRLGLTINPNIGWLRYNDDDAYSPSAKVGFSYGLMADLGFAQNYFFATGLVINSISAQVDYPEGQTNRSSINLQYVEVPLAIKLKTPETDLGRYYGQFGFTAGFKVSGREKLEGINKKQSIDGDDIFRLGLQLGGGAEWRVKDNLSILTGLTFNNGFTRAIKQGSPKTSYLALNVGILF